MTQSRLQPLHTSYLILHTFLLLLSLFLYTPTLSFPAFYDTLLNTQLADDLNLLTVWLPNEQFGFYRPLVFLPAVLMNTLFGGYSPFFGHLYNLLTHLLNVFLLTHLAERLWGKRTRTLTAGLLFATFPFAYQSLAIHGNAAYLTVTTVVLLALHSYLSADRLRPAHIIPLFIVGVLTNESAVLLVPILLLFALTGHHLEAARTAQFWRKHGWLLALLALYLLIYLFLPRGGGPQLDYGGNDPWQKLLIFLQTAAYPLVWFASITPISGQTVVLISTALLISALIWRVWHDGESRRPLLFTFGWWLGASLLIAITLPTYYIADGARLLYLGAGGLALGWALLLDGVWHAQTRWRQGAWGAIVLFIAVTSGRFAFTMIDTYRAVSQPFHTITDIMADQPADDGVVIVNLAQWQAPPQPTYPYTTQFAPFMGDHLFLYELFRVNSGNHQPRPVYTLVVPELQRETPYPYGLYQAFATDRIDEVESPRNHLFVYGFQEDGITADYRGTLERNYFPEAIPEFAAQTEPYTILSADVVICERTAVVSLDLTAMHGGDDASRATTSFFVQLFSEDWRLLGQSDGGPFNLPFGRVELWGSRLQEQRVIELAEGGTAVRALIGTYDSLTGERHLMRGPFGNEIPDNALTVPSTIDNSVCAHA